MKTKHTARWRGVARHRMSKMVIYKTLFTTCSGFHSYGKEKSETSSGYDNRSWTRMAEAHLHMQRMGIFVDVPTCISEGVDVRKRKRQLNTSWLTAKLWHRLDSRGLVWCHSHRTVVFSKKTWLDVS